MGKLEKLLARCKCGVFLNVNEHRDYYESVPAFLTSREDGPDCAKVLQKMVETNTIVELQFYPDTPVGSFTIWHHDLGAALDEALAAVGLS